MFLGTKSFFWVFVVVDVGGVWGWFFFFDEKKENQLSDIFYNSYQMFHSKHIILNNQGL